MDDLNTCKYIRSEQESKRENKILIKYSISIDDIITRKYFQFEKEIIVRKTSKITTKAIFGYTKKIWTIF